MLKLSRKVEYGLMALKKLNSLSDGQTLTVKEIASADKIPEQLLSKLMQLLAKDEIVESIRGTQGGYKLKINSNDLKQIKLSDIMQKFGQPLNVVDCMEASGIAGKEELCPQYSSCHIKSPMQVVQNKVNKIFYQTTLEEIL